MKVKIKRSGGKGKRRERRERRERRDAKLLNWSMLIGIGIMMYTRKEYLKEGIKDM